jgi:hypothetical protein
MAGKSASKAIGQFFNARKQDEDAGAKPEFDAWHVTTRQARTLVHMPGVLILEARQKPVMFRGNLYKVID